MLAIACSAKHESAVLLGAVWYCESYDVEHHSAALLGAFWHCDRDGCGMEARMGVWLVQETNGGREGARRAWDQITKEWLPSPLHGQQLVLD